MSATSVPERARPPVQPHTEPAAWRRRLGAGSVLGELVRQPAGLVGLVVVVGLVIVALGAPQIAPYDDAAQDIANRLQGPSASHLLGTDQLGRDLLSRLIFGTRIALGVAVPAVLGALAIGLVLGLVAGYLGGRIDNALLVVLDTLQSMPAVVLALILIALLGSSLQNVIIVIAAAYIPNYARVSRALVMSAKENVFVEAERTLGASDGRILAMHIVPNIIAQLLVLLAMDIPYAITIEAGLSFLGLGVQPPTPSWGVILADGFERVRDAPWAVIWAGLTLMVTTLGFTLLGESLRDIADPRVAGLRRARP
jgi:peptide/nickel transport system permease protein